MYKFLIRPVLFRMPPERAHHFTFNALKSLLKLPGAKGVARKIFTVNDKRLERKLFGLTFKNPVGLAAGLDKDAKMIDELACLGFGFIEIGTITPKAQPGNPPPRMFRLPEDNALINRMGFNNEGLAGAVKRLRKRKTKIIIGGNIGKNKLTDNKDAIRDYELAFDTLFDVVDYFVVNVSSPNTPNLRALQEKEPLMALLETLKAKNRDRPAPKPILLKIAPDLSDRQLDDIIEIVTTVKIEGVVATNTTIHRDNLRTDKEKTTAIGAGGLSGQPLKTRATEVIRYLYQRSGGAFPIIGTGGIASAEDALEKLAAGASLVQVYTGFIYEGPSLVKRINRAIIRSAEPIDPAVGPEPAT